MKATFYKEKKQLYVKDLVRVEAFIRSGAQVGARLRTGSQPSEELRALARPGGSSPPADHLCISLSLNKYTIGLF